MAAGSNDDARRANAFGAQAGAYARGRPGYPEAALRYCLPPDAQRVLDLGAGTGKVSAGLLELGLTVVAVEPSAAMRALIPPGVKSLAGSAEAIPLEDHTIDAVLVGQAFHWFDRDAALAEIARVLRPSGTLGLLWNRIRTTAPWIEEIARVMHEASHTVEIEPPWHGRADLTDPERRIFAHHQDTDAERLIDNLQSRSTIILATPQRRQPALDRVREIAPHGRFRLPLECAAWRGTRT